MSSFTPQRSPLDRYCRSPLGVRGLCAPALACDPLRRYDRCPLPPDSAPCNSTPLSIWVCESYRCRCKANQSPCAANGQSVDDDHSLCCQPAPVLYSNLIRACYARTNTVVARADLPAGAIIYGLADQTGGDGTPLSTCYPDCSSAPCVAPPCPQWLKASPCPGQSNCPDNVYGPLAPGGIADGTSGTVNVNGCCYQFIAGRNLVTSVPPNAVIVDDNNAPQRVWNTLCCDCLPNCVHLDRQIKSCATGAVTRQQCCCPCGGTFSTTVSHSLTSYKRNAPPPNGDGYTRTDNWLRTGTYTVTYDDNCVQTSLVVSPLQIDHTWSDNAGDVGSETSYDTMPPIRHQCGGIPQDVGIPMMRVFAAQLGVAGFPFSRMFSVPGLGDVDANYACPSDTGGVTFYPWADPAPGTASGTERFTVSISYTCDFFSGNWIGWDVYDDPSAHIETTAILAVQTSRSGASRCADALVGGSSILATGGCGGCGGGGTGGATI